MSRMRPTPVVGPVIYYSTRNRSLRLQRRLKAVAARHRINLEDADNWALEEGLFVLEGREAAPGRPKHK